MTSPDVVVDSESLRAHARMVDETAAMLGEATGGADYLNLHDEVYGEWPGKLFVPLLNLLQDQAVRELHQGADATGHLAELVRVVADGADTTDSNAARRFRDGVR